MLSLMPLALFYSSHTFLVLLGNLKLMKVWDRYLLEVQGFDSSNVKEEFPSSSPELWQSLEKVTELR